MNDIWNGTFVTENLDLQVPESVAFKTLLGLSLRKNPKRAHLLVSTVLGKHIPQKPSIIKYGAALLGEQILVKENILPGNVLSKSSFNVAIATDTGLTHANQKLDHTTENKFVVFGYAETATGLGACVAETLKADYIHSTRTPELGKNNYGGFEEEHSHATSHHITPPSENFFTDKIIVLVDDELTTGKTVINTIEMFEKKQHNPVYYIATLTDLRTAEAHKTFAEFEKATGITVHVVSLVSAELPIPVDSIEKANNIIHVLKQFPEKETVKDAEVVTVSVPYTLPLLKNGVESNDFDVYSQVAETIANSVPVVPTDKTLVLGNEEETYLPLLVAEKLELFGYNVKSSSTTRSPVVSYNNPEYAIRSRIKYKIETSEGLEKRFAYNIIPNQYTHIILLLETEEISTLSSLIAKLKTLTDKITIVERIIK